MFCISHDLKIIPRFPQFPPCSPLAAAVPAGDVAADADVDAAAVAAGAGAADAAAGQLGASPGAPPLPSACVDLSCNLYLDFVFGFEGGFFLAMYLSFSW